MRRCPNCGRQYSEDYSFCLDDGSALVAAAEQNMTPTEVISRPQINGLQPTRSVLPWVAIAILAVAVAGLAVYILIPRSDKAEGDNFQTISSGQKQAPENSPTAINNLNRAANIGAAQLTSVSPAGRWTGDWSSPSGAHLDFDLTLNDQGGNNLTGQIDWTLRRTTRPEKMAKIGMSATEYVNGRFDPTTSTVLLKGYRKDDPNGVLVLLDDYRLKLSGDRLNGAARNGGKWNGRINLSR